MGFATKNAFQQHNLEKHSVFQCRYCNLEFKTEKDRSAHQRARHAPTFECEFCGREFATNEGRLAHQKTNHIKFACGHCGQEFSSEEARAQHEVKHSRYEYCRYCDREFATEGDRDAHEADKHPLFKCNFCDLNFTSEVARWQHEDANHPTGVKCPYCSGLFGNDWAWMQHAKVKHYPQWVAWQTPHIQCGYCSSKFATQSAKDEHERSCDSNRANHIARPMSLSSDRPHLQISFMSADELVEEESSDGGQTPTISPSRSSHSTVDEDIFHSPSQTLSTDVIDDERCIAPSDACLCLLCSRHQQISLFSNADKHVPDDADNIVSDRQSDSTSHRFQCTPCLTLFETREALRDHVCLSSTAMVRPYCYLCFGQFEDLPSVQKHLESLLTCQFCPLRFCSAEALQSHLLTHPTCGKCDKSFADDVSLTMVRCMIVLVTLMSNLVVSM